jgi:Putative prokaryotic signal transducing protein
MAMVTVGSYATEVEAQIAQAILEANGVGSVIVRDDAGGMLPSLHILVGVKLVVPEEDASIARSLLEDDPTES